MKKRRWHLPLTLVFLLMGTLLSLQYQAQNRIATDLTMQRTENLIAMVRGLSEKRQKLDLEIIDLNYQLRTQMESYRDEKMLFINMQAELDKLNTVTGNALLEGQGLLVSIDQYMPILYIDIINIVNELWAAGAEAIAINDHRITNYSTIFYAEYDDNMYITVNNIKLDFPIIISAIGDANNLEKGLTLPGGIIDNLALFKAYPKLEKVDKLKIPATANTPLFFFLEEYVPQETQTPASNTTPINDNQEA